MPGSTVRGRRRVPVSQEEDRQAELYAAFEALGGQLTWDELTRLRGSDEYRPALVGQVMLLLGGDAAAAEEVVQASFAALQDARSQLSGPEQARPWLYRAVVSRARSVRRTKASAGKPTPRGARPSPPTTRGSRSAHLYGPVHGASRAGDGHQYRGRQKPPGRGHVPAGGRGLPRPLLSRLRALPSWRLPTSTMQGKRSAPPRRRA